MSNKEKVTLVGTFSRFQLVKMWFDALDAMELPRKNIILLIFNNTDNILLHNALQEEIKKREKDFFRIDYVRSMRQGGRTLLGQDNNDWGVSKLKPIYEMWCDIKEMIETPVFFQIEDDTIAPPHAFTKLMKELGERKDAVFVTGIETGRSIYAWEKVGMGVHYMKVEGDKIMMRIGVPPETEGVVEIDGSGVYCFAAKTEAWKKAFVGYDGIVQSVPFFGMDNLLTYRLKRDGSKIYADFDVWCDHVQQDNDEPIRFNKKNAISQGTIWIPEFNNYAQGVEIKKK